MAEFKNIIPAGRSLTVNEQFSHCGCQMRAVYLKFSQLMILPKVFSFFLFFCSSTGAGLLQTSVPRDWWHHKPHGTKSEWEEEDPPFSTVCRQKEGGVVAGIQNRNFFLQKCNNKLFLGSMTALVERGR